MTFPHESAARVNLEAKNVLGNLAKRTMLTGSHFICQPPVETTDKDIVVLVDFEDWEAALIALHESGYGLDGSVNYARPDSNSEEDTFDYFQSYRKDDINIIIVCNERFFECWSKATIESMSLNLQLKEERIALFQSILYPKE